MELAQKNCEYYSQSQDIIRSSLSAATLQEKKSETKNPGCEIIAAQPSSTFRVASKASSSVSKLCWFCGRFYHIRNICPARNAICYKCQKKEHFLNVCKSKSAKTTNASIFYDFAVCYS